MDPVERTRRTYEQVAETYRERTVDDIVPDIESFADRLPSDSRVLDAGCGPGRDCGLLRERGLAPVGTDLAAAQLREAREVAPRAAYARGDVRRLPFPDASFDGVWCCAVLLHLPREQLPDALSELARVARPDAPLFVSVPHGEGERVQHAYGTDTGRYMVAYRRDPFSDALSAAGFRVESADVGDRWLSVHARREGKL